MKYRYTGSLTYLRVGEKEEKLFDGCEIEVPEETARVRSLVAQGRLVRIEEKRQAPVSAKPKTPETDVKPDAKTEKKEAKANA